MPDYVAGSVGDGPQSHVHKMLRLAEEGSFHNRYACHNPSVTPMLLAAALLTDQSSIDADRLKATVTKLASWPNRNTNNSTLTEAANWIADEMRKIPGLQVEIMSYAIPKGPRVPVAKDVVQVVGVLPGKSDRRIVIGGHFDTINMVDKEHGLESKAPGANDDASGVALTLEVARALAAKQWENTLVFVAFSGEEQGLLGSKALAERAKQENWKIDAVLSNDMVGNSANLLGDKNARELRVFSEESEHHQSRELARLIAWLGRSSEGSKPKLVFRADRFGRGGDHTPFNQQGFTAVRFVEVHEEYSRQHTEGDTAEFVDFDYLAGNAKLNYLVAASLASAGPPPADVKVDRRQGYDTHLSWTATPGVHYVVYYRETTSPVWEHSQDAGEIGSITIPHVHKDDHFFAVGAGGGIPVEAK